MKRLISFLLMVVMGLGMVSCVSNTESDSVKAIRDAKAAQLLALAELHKAQAEAETLLAKAQAALLEAEARYQAALAEGAELDNQKAKALLYSSVSSLFNSIFESFLNITLQVCLEEIVILLSLWYKDKK